MRGVAASIGENKRKRALGLTSDLCLCVPLCFVCCSLPEPELGQGDDEAVRVGNIGRSALRAAADQLLPPRSQLLLPRGGRSFTVMPATIYHLQTAKRLIRIHVLTRDYVSISLVCVATTEMSTVEGPLLPSERVC